MYAPIFRGVDAHGGRKLYTNRHTHTHTRDSHSDDNNRDYSKRCSSIGIVQHTVYTYAKPLNRKHMRHSGIIIKHNALRVSKHVTESIRNIARGVGIN